MRSVGHSVIVENIPGITGRSINMSVNPLSPPVKVSLPALGVM